ncbi:MAG: hypothetical protein ACFFB3_09050 [Candidatus Hodarchaeota archaeon]
MEESENLLTISLKQAADMFYAAAECYDSHEERKLAARYFTLAGQTYFDLDTRRGKRKAASSYGKAITRYLMADDLQGATFLLDKGKNQGFDTYHFKMAEEALERKIQELGLAPSETPALREIAKSEVVLPRVRPISEALEISLPEIAEVLVEQEEVMPILETFAIEDPIDEMNEQIGQALLENVAETLKPSLEIESSSKVEFITSSGKKMALEPRMSLIPLTSELKDFHSPDGLSEIIIQEPKGMLTTEPAELAEDVLSGRDEESVLMDLERETTAFNSVSEVLNELEESVTDIEVIDRIPFAWQVVGVDAGDLELMKKEVTADGLLFTWTKDRLSPGERVQIKYRLRKRIHRSIALRQGAKISLLSTYHSLHEKGENLLSTEIPYTNTSGLVLDEVLIEDTIPAELIPRSYQPKVTMPAMITGVDNTLFRWLLRQVLPGFNIGIAYDFVEKPLTRWFERLFDDDRGTKVRIKKIAQPNSIAFAPEMLLFFELNTSLPVKFEVLDEIPAEGEVVAVEPMWLMPKIVTERSQKFLSWSFDFAANDRANIILRLRTLSDYAASEPIVRFSDYEIMEGREIQKKREKEQMDLRSFSNRS